MSVANETGHEPPTAADRTATRVAELSYFFPAHNEAENIEALVAEALESPAHARGALRDHLRRRRQPRRHRRARRRARRQAPRDGPRGPPRGEPGLRRRAAQRDFMPSRYPLVAFTDGDRQFRLVDLGRLLARIEEPIAAGSQAPGRRRRVSHQARRSGHPARLRPPLPARAADLLPASRPGCRLRLQALPPRGPRGHPPRIRRRVPLRRAADQGPGAAEDGWWRSACPTTRAWPAAHRGQIRRWCCAPCATSGDCEFGCGSTDPRRFGAASQ